MAASVEDLLRGSAMTYGHIQLFRDDAGWGVSVQHYQPGASPPSTGFDVGIFDDPVEGLRKALIEDDRRTRDLQRKYDASAKGTPEPAPRDPDGMCMICEGGGCDACCEPIEAQVDIEDYIAATTPAADPLGDMFG